MDDGSSDDTPHIVNKYPFIKYYKKENTGLSNLRNDGFLKSKGRYIAFLDDDDEWLPNVSNKAIQLLDKYPDVDAIFADAYVGNDQDGYQSWIEIAGQASFFELPCVKPEPNFRTIETPALFRRMVVRNAIFGGAMIMRSDIFKSYGMYTTSHMYAEDWEMYLRMLACGVKFGFLMEPMAIYRKNKILPNVMTQITQNSEKMKEGFCWALESILLNEHIHLNAEDRLLVKANFNKHLFYYAYSAWNNNDFKLAHKRFAAGIQRGAYDIKMLLYSIVTLFPGNLVKFLRSLKRIFLK